jgi:anti-anti-sigma regulatory factor
MNFKIDTREKFTMITPESDFFSDKLTEELNELINSCLQHKTNIVISFKNVTHAEEKLITDLAAWHPQFYERGISFVLCELNDQILSVADNFDLKESLNITPTESEAWDIVQMEEIERELMGDDD